MTQNNELNLKSFYCKIDPTEADKFLYVEGTWLSLDETTTLIQWLQGNMGMMLEQLMKERED